MYNSFYQYQACTNREGFIAPLLLARALNSYLGRDDLVLDVGCGPGIMGALLKQKIPRGMLLGIDIAEKRLAEARDGKHYTLCVHGDAYRLPLRAGTFDVVVSSAMLGLTDYRSFMEMVRVTKPGGYIAVTAGEIKGRKWMWCQGNFRRCLRYIHACADIEIVVERDIGSGYISDYDGENYVLFILRKSY